MFRAFCNRHLRKPSLTSIFITNFLDMLGFGMVLPIFQFIFRQGEQGIFSAVFSPEELTFWYIVMVASFSVGTLIGAPFLGALSDQYGRKKMLMLTYAINIVSYLVFIIGILEVSYLLLYFSRLFGGVAAGAYTIVHSAIADVSTPETKNKNFGITGIAFGLGFIIGALVGTALCDKAMFSWASYILPFVLSCAINLLNIFYLVFIFKETNTSLRKQQVHWLTGPKNIVKAFSNKSLRNIFAVIFTMTLSFNLFIQLYQYYVIDVFGFSEIQIGYLYVFVGLSIAFAQGVVLRWFTKLLSPERLLAFSLPLFALSYLILLLPGHWSWFLLAMFFFIACQALCFPTSLTIVSNLADKTIQGETIGINQSVLSLAAASPLFFAHFIGVNYEIPMYLGACMTFLAFLIFVFGRGKSVRNH